MAETTAVRKGEITKKVVDTLGLQGYNELSVSKIIVPTIPVFPPLECEIVRWAEASNVTSAAIYLTHTEKNFYLTSCSLSMIKDVTATSLSSSILATINGVSTAILSIPGFTLTVQQDSISVSFPVPIKIDKGSSITVVNSTNVGNVKARGIITGFYN